MMYARLIMLTIRPDDRTSAEDFAGLLSSEMEKLPGYQSATYFCDKRYGEYAVLCLWEGEEEAVIAGRLLCSKIEAATAGKAISVPASKLYEVFEPASLRQEPQTQDEREPAPQAQPASQQHSQDRGDLRREGTRVQSANGVWGAELQAI